MLLLATVFGLFTLDASVRQWLDGSIPVVTHGCVNDAERVNEIESLFQKSYLKGFK